MSKHRNTGLLVLTLTLLLALLAACGPAGEPATPTPPAGDGTGLAQVDSIDIVILESFPVQVHVLARGTLPDSCTAIDQISRERDGTTFRVTLTTARSAEACAQVLTPFEETIPLDVYGLDAGTYTVDVNGVTGTFTLDIDNVPQEG
jgi:inhibitor of cysteine peptidase